MALTTPVIQNATLNRIADGSVFIKPECLQTTGSFKIRGASNKLKQLTDAERACGVVAWSSGNHAQGVAYAARQMGIPATIVMPADAPTRKLTQTKAFGATVVTYDRDREDREAIGREIAARTRAIIVPPYDDEAIIAGQGTVGLELAQAIDALDDVLIPAGGGGLTAGIATAIAALSPTTQITTVEPQAFNDHQLSFATGTRQRVAQAAPSICDALLAPEPGAITFGINRKLVSGGVTVSDDDVRQAMAFAFNELKLVVEPGGAVALAAILSGAVATTGKRVGIILSGGNVDIDVLQNALHSPNISIQ